ncbi:MAG: hypothetical protein EBY52_07375 [Actinobacteria bacterium]|nr:hypothetical protein [Actinomycetota bacterium]
MAITPNLGEASLLAGRPLASVADVDAVADQLAGLGASNVVVTGGSDRGATAVDVLVRADGTIDHLESPWIDTVHVRGSGCTFAAATAAGLARGEDSVDAIRQAKAFVTDRLRASQWADLDGAGPVAHWISG